MRIRREESVVGKKYEVSMEIAGPAAMFTRPDTGAAREWDPEIRDLKG